MAIFPCARPPSRWRMASGTSGSGYVLPTMGVTLTGLDLLTQCFEVSLALLCWRCTWLAAGKPPARA